MDPLAPHRFGSKFLQRVLSPDWHVAPEVLRETRVACEVPRGNCRADIVARCPDFTLEFCISDADGISERVINDQVIETLLQLGATIERDVRE